MTIKNLCHKHRIVFRRPIFRKILHTINSLFSRPAYTGILTLLLLGGTAFAADVEVRVVDKAGHNPVEGASVCLGTSANLNQFGAWLTDEEGSARFSDIPDTTLVLTVSKPQFLGYQSSKGRAQHERVFIVELPSGGLGPQCVGAIAATGGASDDNLGASFQGLEVQSFSLNNGRTTTRDRSVSLTARVIGNPTHYRASEYADFAGSEWLPYQSEPEFVLTAGNARKTVYFQVRRYKELGGAALESKSRIHSDSITLISR